MIYRYKGDEYRFRTGAYEKAAMVIDHLPEDIRNYMKDNQLEKLHRIGESIAEKIREYAKTGKIKKYEPLKKEVPQDFRALLSVKGLGPQTLKMIREAGVMLVIGTDAHDLKSFEYINQGLSIARRGWCEKNQVLNTKSWRKMENQKSPSYSLVTS